MGLPKRHDDSFFKTTRWTLISQMRNKEDEASRKIQNDLYNDYWKPICRYIMSKGNSQEKAYDLTQEFFFKQVIQNGLFEKAHASRGKFRSLLLVALNNFLISQDRHDSADKRLAQTRTVSLETLNCQNLIAAPEICISEEEKFNFAWIQSLLENAVSRLEEFYKTKSPSHWDAFYMKVLEPILKQTPSPRMEEVCLRTGIVDPQTASNIITTVKRKFQNELRSLVREYTSSEEEVGAEISDFFEFLKNLVQDS
ncbi:MAG: sigma-70 family RNA polymerase sigma factor [Sedimentisphaerales bacterium]|nr:sigma-70 family RNA polymerase sigma factor [Sedimentisphaerales bacterium]